MRRVFLLLSACLIMSLVLAPSAVAQQGPACPIDQVNVLLENGEFTCVPGGSAERTPAQDEAIANDPRSNAETPLIESPRNCDEFYGSQASAQEFLEDVTPDDEFNLDADNDGIACEGLLPNGQEGAQDQGFTPQRAEICQGLFPAKPPNSNVPGEGDLECFETAEQAGAFAETGELPAEPAVTTGQYEGDTAEITTLPDTSGPPALAIGAGVALLLAAGGLLLKRSLA